VNRGHRQERPDEGRGSACRYLVVVVVPEALQDLAILPKLLLLLEAALKDRIGTASSDVLSDSRADLT
jgi:hypothetical protein